MRRPSGRIAFVAANPSIDRLVEVESISLGTIHRPDRALAVPGGKGLNAARAAAALGGDVVAIALIGGHAGAWIGAQLAELGLEARLVDGGAETRTCVSVLDRSDGRLTEFYESGSPVRRGAFADLETAVVEQCGAGVGLLAISGSLPPGTPSDGYARLVRLAADRGIRTMVDARGEAITLALEASPTVVKVNADEAAEVAGIGVADPQTALVAAQSIRAAGAKRVVVTLGRDGAVAVDESGAWQLGSPESGPYPVGSGDAFVGGLAVAIARGNPFADAASLGMAAAIANAQMPGAGRLDADAIPRLLGTIERKPL